MPYPFCPVGYCAKGKDATSERVRVAPIGAEIQPAVVPAATLATSAGFAMNVRRAIFPPRQRCTASTQKHSRLRPRSQPNRMTITSGWRPGQIYELGESGPV